MIKTEKQKQHSGKNGKHYKYHERLLEYKKLYELNTDLGITSKSKQLHEPFLELNIGEKTYNLIIAGREILSIEKN